MKEDLSPFFAGLDSVTAIFYVGRVEMPVTGYFDNAFFDTAIGEAMMDTTAPRFTCTSSAVEGLPNQIAVRIKGKLYSVFQFQPEGTGMTTAKLALEEEGYKGPIITTECDEESFAMEVITT